MASKTITVKAAPRESYPGYWCARRFFPGGADVVLEVLDQEDDPPDVEHVDHRNPDDKRMKPDPRRIGKRSERQLRANRQYLVVVDGGELPAPPAPEVTIADQQAQITDLQKKLQELADRLAERDKQLDEQRAGTARTPRRGSE